MRRALAFIVPCFAVALIGAETVHGQPADSMTGVWAFVTNAIEKNPETRAARERGEQARATADAMSAPLYNPELEGELEQFKNDSRQPSKYEVGVGLTLDIGGKRSARARTGAAQANAGAIEAVRVQHDVARRLLTAIAAVSTSREREQNARSQDDVARQFLDVTERSVRAGDVGQPDVDIARLLVLDAETENRAAQAQRLGAELDLRQLCSCEPGELPKLPLLPPAPPQLSAEDMDRLADRSLEFEIARARVEAAWGELQFAQRARIPDPTIGVGVGDDGGQQLVRLRVSIPFPILNTGAAEARAANRALAASELDLEKAGLEAAARVRAAYAAYQSALANLKSWRAQGAPAVAARFNQLRRLLAARELTTTEYLVQLREVLTAASRGLEAERDAWAAYADWIALTANVPGVTGGKV